jgi:DNA-binding response OmpR family regulator
MATILVVNDERLICDLLQIVLSGHGHEVVVASNVRDALKLFTERRPQLTLVDICMPGIDGIELLKQIHWMDPRAAVMVLTGRESSALKKYTMELGATEFLNKDVPLDHLIKAVNVALKRAERESSARRGSGGQDRPVGLLPGPTSVMVVDDDPVIRELLADFLTHRGYHVLTAQTGAAALAVVDEKPPGLIILDIYLPDMNGVAVLRELRARHYFGAVIVLSGSQEERLLKGMLGMGAVELLAKPFDLERLALAIQVGLILTNRPGSSLKSA